MNAVAKAPLAVLRSAPNLKKAAAPAKAGSFARAANAKAAPQKSPAIKPGGKGSVDRSPTGMLPPLNIRAWIDEHRHLLKPPYASKRVWEDRDMIVTVVAGPCNRKDFHVNPTEELIYQYHGDLSVRLVDAQRQLRTVSVRQGDLFLIPSGIPHALRLGADAIALVVERCRPSGEDDQLCFFCERCGETVYEETFDIDAADRIRLIVEEFWSDATMRTCVHCGQVIQPEVSAAAAHAHDAERAQPRGGAAVAGRRAPGKSRAEHA